MFIKIRELIKEFFKSPRLQNAEPALTHGIPNDHITRHSEMRNIELAKLRLEKEALEKNLVIMHRTMLLTLLAVLVSIALGIYAVNQNDKVEVYPQFEVHLDNQKTIKKTD